MKIQFRWPPRPLGLGTPLNLALASPSTRPLLFRNWWLPLVAGVTASIAGLLVNQALFAGASLASPRDRFAASEHAPRHHDLLPRHRTTHLPGFHCDAGGVAGMAGRFALLSR